VKQDSRTPGTEGGACLILKLLGIDAVLDGSLPTVLIFSDGKRFGPCRSAHRTIHRISQRRSGTW
jgi:hypothetical protein